MAELTSRQKKDFAKSIYLGEDLTQEEIAERVGVKRQTVSRWIKEGNWERHKVSITITREEQLKNLYLQLSELNAAINKKPRERGLPTRLNRIPSPRSQMRSRKWKRMSDWLISFLYSRVSSSGCAPTTWHAARRSYLCWMPI